MSPTFNLILVNIARPVHKLQHMYMICYTFCLDPSAAAVSRRAEFFYHQSKISRIHLRLAVSRRKKIHGSAAVKCSASRVAAKAPLLRQAQFASAGGS